MHDTNSRDEPECVCGDGVGGSYFVTPGFAINLSKVDDKITTRRSDSELISTYCCGSYGMKNKPLRLKAGKKVIASSRK